MDYRPLSALLTTGLPSPISIICLFAITIFLVLVYRIQSNSAGLHPHRTPQSPAQIAIIRPQEAEPYCGVGKQSPKREYNLPVRPVPLIWIPIPRLSPSPSSICGRKGSAVTIWPEDQDKDSEERAECQRDGPSDLLSGVGEQFTTNPGRRLSWLVWNDGAVDDANHRNIIVSKIPWCTTASKPESYTFDVVSGI